MIWLLWLITMGVLLGIIMSLFVMMFDDPRKTNGNKRGKNDIR